MRDMTLVALKRIICRSMSILSIKVQLTSCLNINYWEINLGCGSMTFQILTKRKNKITLHSVSIEWEKRKYFFKNQR